MIVAMVGTGPDSFDRMVRPLDNLAGSCGWEVFVQLGHTRYEPQHCRFERFLERDLLMGMIAEADIVVSQGGYGGIRDALTFNKSVVAVPRYPELHESPDHQDEMVRAMERQGYLIGVYDVADLKGAIERAAGFVPAPRAKSLIPTMLTGYVTSRIV